MPAVVPKHAVVILAAGASTRLGQPKQLIRQQDETLVRRAARAALATSPADAVVVVGAHADAVLGELADLGVRAVICADWKLGMGASIRAGIAALPGRCAGALFVLCDQPALDASHLQQICALWRSAPEKAVASMYAHRAGVPALLPQSWFGTLSNLRGDRGARELLSARAGEIAVVSNEALAFDIDTADDLKSLR